MSAKNYIFRHANVDDMILVHQMIQELANFLKSPDGPQQTVEDLIRDTGLNGGTERCHIFILESQKEGDTKVTTIGYAICYIFYSSWIGRNYFLDNIYIKPEYRKTGAGTHLLAEIARKTKEIGCKRLSLYVAIWNPARTFYENFEAQDNTVLEGRRIYRVKEDKLNELAKQLEI